MSPAKPYLNVSLTTPDGILFQGKASSVILPGEQGIFEVLPHHKPFLSRLRQGEIVIGDRVIPIRRGIVKIVLDSVQAIVEITQPKSGTGGRRP